ncbi:MAG: serine hydrolase [Pseudomonadota bacterium]
MRITESGRVLSIVLAAMFGLQGCGGESRAVVAADSSEQWALSSPAEQGMDPALLASAVSDLPSAPQHKLASMLVLRHGKPVLEQYWNGYDQNTLHDLRSATKSITALLTGIAIDQHMLAGVDEPISTYLAASYPGAPALRRKITIAHILMMRSGLACNDWDVSSPGNESTMYETGDWVGFVMNLASVVDPGTVTQYCTGGPVVMGRIIAGASKKPIPQFADTYLFGPLGIKNARWADFDQHRQTDTGGHIQLRPRDMAKLGQLVLQRGAWNGVQLVSESWIAQATAKHTQFSDGSPYGYLWWQRPMSYKGRQVTMNYADGNGGQYIFVVPELDLVAVFTGENYDSNSATRAFTIMSRYILPAVQ